jgi:hypothetical protein
MGNDNTNRFGLSRKIPADVKFQVRKREGFGCVICGVGIIEYEHVDPEFRDAEVHDPLKITILCPTCHAKKTRGFLSVEAVKKAMLSPKCLEEGFSKEVLDIGTVSPKLVFAGANFQNCVYPLMVEGKPLFMIQPPEIEKGPWRFSGRFFDSLEN